MALPCPKCSTRMFALSTRCGPDALPRRRYECPKCGERVSTVETIIEPPRGRGVAYVTLEINRPPAVS